MYILNYLPDILLAMLLSFNIGLFIRLLIEGASFKTAVFSLFRFYFVPLAFCLMINDFHNHKRRILFDLKNDKDFSDDFIEKAEKILESKLYTIWFVFKFILRYYRLCIDAFIKASVEYEKRKSQPHKKKKEKFFEFFLNDKEIENTIFHKGLG